MVACPFIRAWRGALAIGCWLIVLGAVRLPAADLYWTGAADQSWSNAANWSATSGGAGGAGVPGASDDVHFDGGSAISCTVDPAGDLTVASWNQDAAYAGVVTFLTTYTGGFQTVTVVGAATVNGGTWTHADNGVTAPYRLHVEVGGAFVLGASAAINADTRGWDRGYGPGRVFDAGGGGHGGRGGGGVNGGSYDDLYAPELPGSGGGHVTYGWSGGGAVRLGAASMTLAGTISANGESGTGDRGCGAGGAIWLTAGTMSGAGALHADGGSGAQFGRGGGGGGRIALDLTAAGDFSGLTGAITAAGGYADSGAGGAAGTIYLQRNGEGPAGGRIVIDNAGTYCGGGAYTDLSGALQAAGGTWSVAGGTLSQTATADGDPRKMLVRTTNGAQELQITARVRVDAWTDGDYSRAGVGLCTDSNGNGYNLLFHNDHNTVEMLDDGVVWGPTKYSFAWSTGVWYWFKLKYEAGTLYGRIWQDGDTEPATWPYTWTRSGRIGVPSLNGGSAGLGAGATASFDDVTVTALAGGATLASAGFADATNWAGDVHCAQLAVLRGARAVVPTSARLTLTGTGTTLTVDGTSALTNLGTVDAAGTGFDCTGEVVSTAAGTNWIYRGQADDSPVAIADTAYANVRFDNPGTVFGCAPQAGKLLRETYATGGGTDTLFLRGIDAFPDSPSSTAVLSSFEGPSNIDDHYGARIRGYITAPQTGNYTFWVASDNGSKLMLSTDDDTRNLREIANVYGNSWTGFRDYNAVDQHQSAPIALVAGRRYAVEMLCQEDTGGDYFSAAWRLPDNTFEGPIPGSRLSRRSTPATPGAIDWEKWSNTNGQWWDATFGQYPSYPDHPDGVDFMRLAETPTNIRDNYGTRLRGFVVPPVSGNYTFWVAGDDGTDLYVSPDADPAHKVRIAYQPGSNWVGSRNWFVYGSQQSAPVALVAGQRYYLEALLKEAGGGDNLAVAWQRGGGSFEGPIPGAYLQPITGCMVTGSLTIAAGATFDLAGAALIATGATFSNDGTFRLHGDEDVRLTMDTDSGTTEYTGSGTYPRFVAGHQAFNLRLAGTGTWTHAADLTVGGNLTIAAGATLRSTTDLAITLTGNWANGGTYTAGGGSSTVRLVGGDQTITGSTTFNRLSKAVTTTRTLTFAAGSTQVVTGALSLSGAVGNRLLLRSSSGGSAWSLTPSGTRNVELVDVQDGINTTATFINPPRSVDGGSNVRWFDPDARYWVAAAAGVWTDTANWSVISGGTGGAAVPVAASRVQFDAYGLGDCLLDAAADATVTSWTQTAGYPGTVNIPTTYSGGFRTLTITGDCLLDGGTWTHPGNSIGRVYRLNAVVGGALRVGAAARVRADGAGYGAGGGGGATATVTLSATNNSNGDNTSFVDDIRLIPGNAPELLNSSFETPVIAGFAAPAGADWSFTAPAGIQHNGSGYNAAAAPDGDQGAYIQGSGAGLGVITQTVTMPAGTYRLRCFMAYRPFYDGTQPLQISVGGRAVGAPIAPASTSYIRYTSDPFTVVGGATAISFAATDGTGDRTSFVDDVQLIPEGVPAFINAGFEAPAFGPGGYAYAPGGTTWAFSIRAALQHNGSAWGAPDALEGTQTAALQADNGTDLGRVTQDIVLPAGAWRLRFVAARRGFGSNQPIRLLVNGSPVGADYLPPRTNWDYHTSDLFTIGTIAAAGEGGAYGGRGGEGAGGTGGTAGTYGLPTAPIEPGGGSAGGAAGGGAIRLAVAGAATIDGALTAAGAGAAGGGGAGGSVWLSCATLAGSGQATADGGATGGAGGAGGGGRVALVTAGTGFGSIATSSAGGAAGGTGGNGAAGTVYREDAVYGAGNGQLVIDNQGRATAATVLTALNDADALSGAAQDLAVAVGSIAVRGGAKALIGTGDTLSVSGAAPDDGIATGLVGRWRLEDGSGASALDDTGTANGALTGGTWTTGQFAGAWKAHYQDGSDYITIPWTSAQNVQGGSHTLSLWTRLATLPPRTQNYRDYEYGLLAKAGFHTGLLANGDGGFVVERYAAAGPTALHLTAGPWSPGRFHHMVVTVDQATGVSALYIDGRQAASRTDAPNTAIYAYGATPWRIGIGDPFNGTYEYPADADFCDVRVYDRALSAAQVATVMRSAFELAPTTAMTTDGTLQLGGGPFAVAGTLTNRSGSLVRYTGYADDRAVELIPVGYHHLTVDNAASTFSFAADTVVGGDLRIAAGTTLAALGHSAVVAGDWTDLGTFAAGGGNVVLNGAGGGTQTISGDTTFAQLTATASAARTLRFAAGSTQTVTGALTLVGSSGNRLALRSTAGGAIWNLAPSGSRICRDVDVQDGVNLTAPSIDPPYSLDSGNNTQWFGSGRYWVTGTAAPLDAIATVPAGAYGLRRLRAAYAGPAVRVRRASDSTESDIGFTATGDLDAAALLAFTGGGSATVRTWYDQSGAARDAQQATAALQPLLVTGGVLVQRNGRPALGFAGGQDLAAPLPSGTITGNGGTAITVTGVFTAANGLTQSLFGDDGPGTDRLNVHAPWIDGTTYWDAGDLTAGGRVAVSLSWPSLSVGTFRRDGSLSDVWRNGTQAFATNGAGSSLTGNSAVHIGSYNGIVNFMSGAIAEMTFFPAGLSDAQRRAVEAASAGYYGIGGSFAGGIAGTWSQTDHWAYSSGGFGGAALPGAITPVFFDGNGRGDCTLDTAAATGDLTMASAYTGALALASYDLSIAGDADLRSGGTFAATTGRLVLAGAGAQTVRPPAAVALPSVAKTGAGTATLATNDLSVAGGIAISGGTLAGGGRSIALTGDWANSVGSGGFSAGAGTVGLTGAGGSTQTISGSTTFSNLSATATSARTLAFAAGATQTVTGALALQGASGQRLTLRSTIGGSPWRLDPQGTRSCTWLAVSDARNLRLPLILPTHSTDGGGTTWWFGSIIGLCWDGTTTSTTDGQTGAVAWPLGGLAEGDVRTSGSGADAARVFAVRNAGDQPVQIIATAASGGSWAIGVNAGVETCALAIAPAATFTSLDTTTSPGGVPIASALAEGSIQPFRLRLGAPVATVQAGAPQTLTITLNASPPP